MDNFMCWINRLTPEDAYGTRETMQKAAEWSQLPWKSGNRIKIIRSRTKPLIACLKAFRDIPLYLVITVTRPIDDLCRGEVKKAIYTLGSNLGCATRSTALATCLLGAFVLGIAGGSKVLRYLQTKEFEATSDEKVEDIDSKEESESPARKQAEHTRPKSENNQTDTHSSDNIPILTKIEKTFAYFETNILIQLQQNIDRLEKEIHLSKNKEEEIVHLNEQIIQLKNQITLLKNTTGIEECALLDTDSDTLKLNEKDKILRDLFHIAQKKEYIEQLETANTNLKNKVDVISNQLKIKENSCKIQENQLHLHSLNVRQLTAKVVNYNKYIKNLEGDLAITKHNKINFEALSEIIPQEELEKLITELIHEESKQITKLNAAWQILARVVTAEEKSQSSLSMYEQKVLDNASKNLAKVIASTQNLVKQLQSIKNIPSMIAFIDILTSHKEHYSFRTTTLQSTVHQVDHLYALANIQENGLDVLRSNFSKRIFKESPDFQKLWISLTNAPAIYSNLKETINKLESANEATIGYFENIFEVIIGQENTDNIAQQGIDSTAMLYDFYIKRSNEWYLSNPLNTLIERREFACLTLSSIENLPQHLPTQAKIGNLSKLLTDFQKYAIDAVYLRNSLKTALEKPQLTNISQLSDANKTQQMELLLNYWLEKNGKLSKSEAENFDLQIYRSAVSPQALENVARKYHSKPNQELITNFKYHFCKKLLTHFTAEAEKLQKSNAPRDLTKKLRIQLKPWLELLDLKQPTHNSFSYIKKDLSHVQQLILALESKNVVIK